MGANCAKCIPKKSGGGTNQKTNNSYPYNGVAIQLIEGDLADATTEAIINSCERPYLPSASSIVKKAGDELQQQLKSFPALKEQQVISSPAGQLKCQSIIHLALPIWKGGEEGFSNDLSTLRTCYLNAFFQKVLESKVKSVAIGTNCGSPALRFPAILHSQAIVMAICSFLDDKPKDLRLEKFSIYCANSQQLKIFELHIQNRIDINSQKILKLKFKENEHLLFNVAQNNQKGQQSTTNQRTVSENNRNLVVNKMDEIKLNISKENKSLVAEQQASAKKELEKELVKANNTLFDKGGASQSKINDPPQKQ